jgi:cardiolipin synthase
VHADDFLYTLQSTCQAALHHGNHVTVYTNGPRFYPAMLEAIRSATRSINLECYIMQPGTIADQFIEALSDRARLGINVTVVVDAIGSLNLWGRPVARLREAGCRIEWYQRLEWHRLHRLNNRTHRELLIVDGRIAFVGGAGIADWWAFPHKGRSAWRDTMARIEGPIVATLQGVAAENWLEC